MEPTFLNWIFALLPVIVMLVLMLGFRWGGRNAGAVSWLVAVVVAVTIFGAGIDLLIVAQIKALLLSLDVLLIVWMALLLYHVADEAGAVKLIGERLPGITANRMMQALLLSWVFVSLLQGMGGFGVPVAVVAPLLVSLGYGPIRAVVMASIGHGWAVTFGSLGTSFVALIAVTGVPGEVIAPDAAILLGIASFFSGSIVAWFGAGTRGLIQGLPALLILSLVMGAVQYFLATNGLWTLGATGAAFVGAIVGVLLTRLPMYRNAIKGDKVKTVQTTEGGNGRSLFLALSAYVILILLAFSINLIPYLKTLFNSVRLEILFPEVTTSLGWTIPEEYGRRISIFGHPGAILLYASLLAFIIYALANYYTDGAPSRIFRKVSKGGIKASLGIIAIVSMATIMGHAGMIDLIARGISENVGETIYPLIAPFIGTLGAFMTGSNTNSNVVFGELQMQTAQLLGLSVPLILAAQTAGASLGSVFAPAKVIVGCSTVGLNGQEGPVIRKMLAFGMIPVIIVAILVFLIANL